MKNILIVNQKGGVGKSTLADLLVWEFEKAEIPCSFYDLDGQGGVVHETFENPKAKVAVIDTPGALQKDMHAWIKEASLIIVPTKATMMDVKPLQRMMELVKDVKCPVMYVEMMWNRFTTAASFEEWLKSETDGKYQILRIPQSEQFAQAVAIGCSVIDYAPKSSAAEAASAFVDQVRKTIKL